MDEVTSPLSTRTAPISATEVRALSQRSNARGLVQLAGHVAAIAASCALYAVAIERGAPWPMIAVALLAYGFTLVTMFAALHETVHRTAFASLALNNAVSWLAGVASFYNSTFYRHYHGWHHRFTQIPGKDPELDDPKPTNFWTYAVELSGVPWWIGKLRTYAMLARGRTQAYGFLNEKTGPDAVRSVRFQLAVYGANWLNYAKTGDPNGAGTALAWPKYDAATDQHVTLVSPPSVNMGLQKAACDYWDAYLKAM